MRGASLAGLVCLALLDMPRNQSRAVDPRPALSPEARQALTTAIKGRGGAQAGVALYGAAVERLGRAEPYRHILRMMVERDDALRRSLKKHSLPYPGGGYLVKASDIKTPKMAAQAGLEHAAVGMDMYRRLIDDVADAPDVARLLREQQAETRDVIVPILSAALKSGGLLPDPQRRRPARDAGGVLAARSETTCVASAVP